MAGSIEWVASRPPPRFWERRRYRWPLAIVPSFFVAVSLGGSSPPSRAPERGAAWVVGATLDAAYAVVLLTRPLRPVRIGDPGVLLVFEESAHALLRPTAWSWADLEARRG